MGIAIRSEFDRELFADANPVAACTPQRGAEPATAALRGALERCDRRRAQVLVEVLVLSACETAAGNERAALGPAGVAIRAGARSALGSLWSISDEATYYRQPLELLVTQLLINR